MNHETDLWKAVEEKKKPQSNVLLKLFKWCSFCPILQYFIFFLAANFFSGYNHDLEDRFLVPHSSSMLAIFWRGFREAVEAFVQLDFGTF